MQNSNPFTIRLELIKLAKEMLLDEYHTTREIALEHWRNHREDYKHLGNVSGKPSYTLTLPAYPTEQDVLKKAEVLNQFVSKTK